MALDGGRVRVEFTSMLPMAGGMFCHLTNSSGIGFYFSDLSVAEKVPESVVGISAGRT